MMLVICENNVKSQLLTQEKKLTNIKYMDRKTFINKTLYQFLPDAKLEVSQKFGICYANVNLYFDAINLIKDIPCKDIANTNINLLLEITDYLKKHRLIVEDENFINYFDEIIVYNYPHIDPLFDKALKKHKNVTLKNMKIKDKIYNVYEAFTLEDEVRFVFKQIASLLNQGIDIQRIKILNATSEYEQTFFYFEKMYNIKTSLRESMSIISNNVVQKVLEMALNNNPCRKIFEIIKDENKDIVDKIIPILNRYVDKSNFYEALKEDLKNVSFDNITYVDEVKVYNLFDYVIDDNDYVFVMGFNQKSIPHDFYDDDFINDNIKSQLGLKKKTSLSDEEMKNTIAFLSNINHLTISYKLASYFETYYKTRLLDELTCQIHLIKNDATSSYSRYDDQLLYARKIDELIKTGKQDESLAIYHANYKIPYDEYDNRYQKINFHAPLTLSYTSLENYYECPFKYYLKYILRLDPFVENFSAKLGTAIHAILQQSYTDDFQFDDAFEKQMFAFSDLKEQFYFNKTKKSIENLLAFNKDYENKTGLKPLGLEMKFKVILDDDVSFVGIIDKIYQKEHVLMLVDYKTGMTKASLDNLNHGINMQLPIYLYLLYNSEYKDEKIGGFYLQHVIKELGKSDNQEEDIKNYLKFDGYSNDNLSILAVIDPTFETSEYIKSLKVKKDGNFYATAKVLNNDQIKKLIDIAQEKIIEAKKLILQNEFKIHPLMIDNVMVGCRNCKFEDICFRSYKDYNRVKSVKFSKEGEQ